MSPPAPSGPTAWVRHPNPSEKWPSGRSGYRQGVGAFARAGLQGQAQPLVQAIGGFPLHALQVQCAQNHISLRGEDAEREVIEAAPALGVPNRVPQEMPSAEVPLCSEFFGRQLDFHRRREWRAGQRRQVGAPHRRHRAEPRLFWMSAGPFTNGRQMPGGEFPQKLPRRFRLRGQVQWQPRDLRRRGCRRLRVETPNVLMACRIRVRVAVVDGIHHLAGELPGSPAGPGFSDGQLDNGGVANMVALPRANHERHHVARLDRRFEELCIRGVVRDSLGAAGADDAVRQDLSTGRGVMHNRPFDAIASMSVSHRHVGPDVYLTLDGTAPTNGHIAVRQRVHGDAPWRDAQVAREARLARRVGAEPRNLASGPAAHERHARKGSHLCLQQLLGRWRVGDRSGGGWRLRLPGGAHEEAVFWSQDRSMFEVCGQEREAAGLGPYCDEGSRHIVSLGMIRPHLPPPRLADV
jgi:hypothetical protein